jgi:nitrite reductase/ring-hydroxylating ferredoxin subunit
LLLSLRQKCSGRGGTLAEGKLEGDSVVCPWHGSRFSLETGEAINGPSAFPQPRLETRVRNGQIEVRRTTSG